MWNDTYTAVFVTRVLPSILMFRCISFLWFTEYRQALCFALHNGLLLSLHELDIEKYSFLRVVFNALNRKKKAGRNSDKQYLLKYRVIYKSLRNFRTRLRNNQERQDRKEHINRQRNSQIFFVLGALAYLQVPPLGGSRDEKWRAQ